MARAELKTYKVKLCWKNTSIDRTEVEVLATSKRAAEKVALEAATEVDFHKSELVDGHYFVDRNG